MRAAHNARQRSGKPNGKPKSEIKREFQALLREHLPAAAAFLLSVMQDESAPVRDRLTAAREIFDRAIGRPRQAVDATLTPRPEEFTGTVQWVVPGEDGSPVVN